MLQNLVFLKYNQTLKERQNCNDKIDPVILDDINASSEWLLGDEAHVGQADTIYDDDDLDWLDVELASGAAEPVFNTRRQAALLKAATAASETARQPPSQPKRSCAKEKGKKAAAVIDEYDSEFVNWENEENEDEEEEIGEMSRVDEEIGEKQNEDFYDF